MAIGDAAAAKGMAVVPQTAPVSKGYEDTNQTRDYIAAEIDERNSQLVVQQTDPGHVEGRVWISWA